jgi:hypothetical protein
MIKWLLPLLLACGEPAGVTVEVVRTGSGQGYVGSEAELIDCGDDCTATITRGSILELQAAAATGSTFTGWSSPCDHAMSICRLIPTEDIRIEAHFEN